MTPKRTTSRMRAVRVASRFGFSDRKERGLLTLSKFPREENGERRFGQRPRHKLPYVRHFFARTLLGFVCQHLGECIH